MSLDDSFRALNRYMCRKIIDQMRRHGPMSVAEIHSRMKIGSRAAVSQSLALLLKAGLVSLQRQGRNHFYEIRNAGFKELVSYLGSLQ